MSTRKEVYLADRAEGMTYRQIAAKHGVSYQAVYCACTRREKHFRPYTEAEVIFPAMRRFLNENEISRTRLAEVLGGSGNANGWMRGIHDIKKRNIDKLLDFTGMTYEQLFGREEAAK